MSTIVQFSEGFKLRVMGEYPGYAALETALERNDHDTVADLLRNDPQLLADMRADIEPQLGSV